MDNLELEKLKTQTLIKRYNHKHDSKGRFASSGSGGVNKTMSKSDVTNQKIRDFYDEYVKQTGDATGFDNYKANMKDQYEANGGDEEYDSFDDYVAQNHESFFPEKYKSSASMAKAKSDVYNALDDIVFAKDLSEKEMKEAIDSFEKSFYKGIGGGGDPHIYNALSNIAMNNNMGQKEMKEALDWFKKKYYEYNGDDED